MCNVDMIKSAVQQAALTYLIKPIDLFGSYAAGNAHEGSDQETLSEMLGRDVDIVELPLQPDGDLIIDRRLCVYGA